MKQIKPNFIKMAYHAKLTKEITIDINSSRYFKVINQKKWQQLKKKGNTGALLVTLRFS